MSSRTSSRSRYRSRSHSLSGSSSSFRARKINSTPGPAEFFRVVNYAAARHLAHVPVALPDLTEVLAEVARTGT